MGLVVHVSRDVEILRADVEDWEAIGGLREYLEGSRANNYISADPQSLKAFLHHSFTFPERVGLLLCRWQGRLVGMAAVLLVDQPVVVVPGLRSSRQAFIHSVYILPWVWDWDRSRQLRVPGRVGVAMSEGIEKWATFPRSDGGGGARFIYGNVRLDGNFGAFARKFGYEKQSVVIGKSLVSSEVDHG